MRISTLQREAMGQVHTAIFIPGMAKRGVFVLTLFSALLLSYCHKHHDRDLVTPAHENHPLSPRWGERGWVRGLYFHGKKAENSQCHSEELATKNLKPPLLLCISFYEKIPRCARDDNSNFYEGIMS